ncbi:unknown [Eggerthella sp. CAG:209]|nr:unknown [Eggerthella sp. CAG:209]
MVPGRYPHSRLDVSRIHLEEGLERHVDRLPDICQEVPFPGERLGLRLETALGGIHELAGGVLDVEGNPPGAPLLVPVDAHFRSSSISTSERKPKNLCS